MHNIVKISKMSSRFRKTYMNIQSGSIISVFDKVINIMTEEGVYTLQESSVPLSPLSIVIEESYSIQSLGIKPNSILTFNKTNIESNKFIFHLKDAEVFDSNIKQINNQQDLVNKLQLLIKILSKMLNTYVLKNDRVGGLMDVVNYVDIIDHSIIFQIYPENNNVLLSYLKNKISGLDIKSTEFTTKLASLIGLGFGLTPSCDDFIVGFISVLVFSEYNNETIQFIKENLIKEVNLKLNTTTQVSSAFLKSAISFEFAETLINFYNSIIEFNEKNIEKCVDNITATGHSSGIDSLNGIIFGFKLISLI